MVKLHKDISEIGLKVTPQRLAILKFIKENRIHPTAEKVHSEVLRDYPAISLTTVYKTLAKFAEMGMIKELDIDPNKMRFDGCTESHDHFHCQICDNVYDVFYNDSIIAENIRSRNVEGHHIESVSINMKGVCRNCGAVSP